MGKLQLLTESPRTSASARGPHPLVPIRTTSVKTFAIVWIGAILLCFPAYALIAVSWVTYHHSNNGAWVHYLYRQKEALLARRATQGHRLIIVGGSNCLFGIDAELIERKLHIPTVNFGTHGGMGVNYMLHRVSKNMRPGDIVMLDMEYDAWRDDYRDSPGPAFSYIWTYDKRYLAEMPMREVAGMIASIPLSDWTADLESKAARSNYEYKHFEMFQGYPVSSLDQCGDMRAVVVHSPITLTQYPFTYQPEKACLDAVRAFGARAKAMNVRLMMTCPNLIRPVPDVPPAMAQEPPWFGPLMKEMGVTVLNEPTEVTFPGSWFMDSAYHSNPCCRRVRTEDVIERLRPQLGLPSVPAKPTGYFLVSGYDHRLSEGNLFVDDPGMCFRYLREDTEGDPHAVTPAQVAKIVHDGTPVYTDSEQADELLAKAGLDQQVSATGKIPIADWFARYPSNLFCLATPPNHPLDPAWKKVVPEPVHRQLSVNEAACAIVFGSGRYAPYKYIIANRINAHVEVHLPKLFRQPSMIPISVGVQAWGRDGGGPLAIIWVDSAIFYNNKQPGITVSVIDPEIGAVIETVTFDSGPDLQTWKRFRVKKAEPKPKNTTPKPQAVSPKPQRPRQKIEPLREPVMSDF